ncbi:DNA translocase FtsK [Paracoccus pacificus]|uniref:DNA translocase FtsK n=1 Tax=Paracoccus pacificus TaxID=1463598 RepID=A0ABW4R2H3_9RHOB
MASWQAKHRDPLFDQSTQAALERRGKELLGAGLIVLGVLIAMMLGSWSPDDPSFLAATDEPAENLLGRMGAYIASPLMMIAGIGSWMLAVGAVVWGLRFMLHRGEDRVMRAVFLPIAVAILSIYATSMTPPQDWVQSYGLGGHFGDMVMGAMLSILPVKASIGIKFLALLMAVASVVATAIVLGFSKAELGRATIWLADGFATARRVAMIVLGRGAQASVTAARVMKERAEARRARARAEGPDFAPGEDVFKRPVNARAPMIAERGHGHGATMVQPDPELIDKEPSWNAMHAAAPSDDHIRSRIADVVRLRAEETAGDGQRRAATPVSVVPSVVAAVASRFTRAGRLGQGASVQARRAEPPVTGAVADYDAEDLTDLQPGTMIEPAEPERAEPFGVDTRRVVVPATPRAAAPSRKARAEAEPELNFGEKGAHYELPPLSLLASPSVVQRHTPSDEALNENARMLEAVLDDYGVKGQIIKVRPGPVVTLYELEPAPGLKASRVIGLADDIARSMSALSARVSTVPGRSVIGIELPNARREKVVLREILGGREFGDGTHRLPLALGKDIGGDAVVANLAKMPHLLIAGTTGSGKSVAINTMILSLLYKLTPEECRLIMIDPKMLELSVYDGIPHLLSPVVTDPKKAVVALKWVVSEMEERYRKMSKMGVRNIEGFNGRVAEALSKGEMFRRTVQTGFDDDTGEPVFETEEFQPQSLPYIVVIVDEMADLMMVAGKEIEACIQRLAQMARASGIHLIMATQRPSVDVITGTIKANFPTRISFQVTSKIDSRTILGEQGAEQLLGQGDMLYMAGGSKITRVHGPFVSDEEVEEIVNHLKSFGPPDYMSGVVEGPDDEVASDIDAVLGLGGDGSDDALYDQAVAIVARDRKCSTSYIQRKLGIGYNKAARLVEQMEDQGVVSSANHVGKREVLVPEG